MSIKTAEEIRKAYLKWIADNTRIFQKGDIATISTPFLNPHNDHIEIFIEPLDDNKVILHDGGETIEDLKWQGVDFASSSKRQKIFDDILQSYGVKRNGDRIETIITPNDAGIKKHFFIQAILSINDMYLLAQHRVTSLFYEMVKQLMDEKEINYSSDIIIQGKSIQHRIEFLVKNPKSNEKIIKLINNPTKQQAELATFMWVDIKDVRPASSKVVFLNDKEKLGGDAETILNTYTDKVLLWSQQEKAIEYLAQ